MSEPKTIKGQIERIGDDDTGQPRIIIHSTRDELRGFPVPMLFTEIEITFKTIEPAPCAHPRLAAVNLVFGECEDCGATVRLPFKETP